MLMISLSCAPLIALCVVIETALPWQQTASQLADTLDNLRNFESILLGYSSVNESIYLLYFHDGDVLRVLNGTGLP